MEKWNANELKYIKRGEGRDSCRQYYDLCESCKALKIRIRNFYSDIDLTELNEKVIDLQNKVLELSSQNKSGRSRIVLFNKTINY